MKFTLKLLAIGLALYSMFFYACQVKLSNQNQDWKSYGGNNAGNRYSPLHQVDRQNVKHLQLAWTYKTGDDNNPGNNSRSDIQCQPLVINGILYGTTPTMKLFAVKAVSGEQIWKFDPYADTSKKPRFHPLRGMAYWEDGNDKRILYGVGSTLYSINALTGYPDNNFGTKGEVDLHTGLGDTITIGHDVSNLSVTMTSPGTVYKDHLIIGCSLPESGDAAPGYIRSFNIRTGKLEWVFHTIPLPGEYGYDTWSKDSYKKIGGANSWSGMVLDEKRGIVYAGTGSPSVDFYGGGRTGENLFANCIIALNAETGKRLWHFQTTHHDLWDRDLPCPPNLLTVTRQGKRIDALAQATKDGLVFVVNRETGEPLFPVRERAVPVTPALPGEHPWPTQPVPDLPAPFAMQELTEENITDRTPEAHAYVLNRYRNSSHGNKSLPPSEEGSLNFGLGGGAEWGGNAVDTNGILYINANNMLWFIKMRAVGEKVTSPVSTKGSALFNSYCFTCHGAAAKKITGSNNVQSFPDLTDINKRFNRSQISALLETGKGRMPAFKYIPKEEREIIVDFLLKTEPGSPVKSVTPGIHNTVSSLSRVNSNFPYFPPFMSNGINQFRDNESYPAVKPPWGTLNAINLNTGKFLWQVVLGEYPELSKKGIPATGTENHGGMVVTAGGLIFIAATYDEKLRAFDSETGKILWEYKLPAGGFATPITYMINGKQYIVIAAGGRRYGLPPGDSYLAFSLPQGISLSHK